MQIVPRLPPTAAAKAQVVAVSIITRQTHNPEGRRFDSDPPQRE
jgi:hypothetical protein